MTRLLFLIKVCLSILWISIFLVSCSDKKVPPENTDFFDPVMEKAWKLADSGDIQEAFNYLDSVFAHLDFTPGNFDLHRKYNFRSHHLIGYYRDYDQADLYVDSSLMVLKGYEKLYTDDYLSSLLQKGYIRFYQNRYTEAFLYYHKGQMTAREYGTQCRYANLTASLARMTYNQGKYRDAIPYFWEAYVQAANCDSSDFYNLVHLRQEQLSNIGLVYEQLESYDSAIYFYNQALNFINRYEGDYPEEARSIKTARAVIWGNMGSVYKKLGAYDTARILLEQSITVNKQPGYDSYDARLNQIKLAGLHLLNGDFKGAKKEIDCIRKKLDSTTFEEAELRWRQLIWEYYDRIGNTDSAYRSYLDYVAYKSMSEAKRRELPGVNFQLVFENRSKQHQIELLQRDNRLKAVYLTFATLVSIMGAFIFMLVRRNYIQSKKNVAELTNLNRRIIDQNMYLHQALDALEESQQANNRIMKAMAHDLRNPIAAMVGISDLLLAEGLDQPDSKEMVAMIGASGKEAIRLMEGLLHANDSMPMESVALEDLMEYSVELMRFRAMDKNIRLKTSIKPARVMANRQSLWRVLNNLIVNAIKFTPEQKAITVGSEIKNDKVVIFVKDEGIGIPDEIKPNVFNGYSGSGRQGTSGEASFGMGLTITKSIVEQHKGRIWFESEVGKGSTFFVELPLTSDQTDS